jgi:general secretion pathway protein I
MKRTRAAGFTLLEVLVALAIIAIALTALVALGGRSADTTRALALRIQARWVAQNQLSLAQAEQRFPPAGELTGEDTMSGQTFSWRQKISDTPNPNFRRLEIFISHEGALLVQLTTLLGRPAP